MNPPPLLRPAAANISATSPSMPPLPFPRHRVHHVNAASGALVGKITGLERDHGVAIVPALGCGFIGDGDAGQAAIFDLKTLKKPASARPIGTPIPSSTIPPSER